MAFRFSKNFLKDLFLLTKPISRNKSQRRTLGKPPGVARSLEQRLEELNFRDPKVHYKVDIGFPRATKARKEVVSEHIELLRKNKANKELELLSRNNQLVIPLEELAEDWAQTVGALDIKAAAEHYSVYQDLFGDAYFIPSVILNVKYCVGHDSLLPVYRGNTIKPQQAMNKPEVTYKSSEDSLWTLAMVTPDGHFTEEKGEYVHWLVGNIKGSEVESGETLIDYLQPFPADGIGYCRYIFLLYKQEGMVDYTCLKKSSPCLDLGDRSLKTYDFYKDRQDVLTPAGLSFFQADWDSSVDELFHQVLKMEAPRYSYDFPSHFHPKQTWFPIRKPFNLYMDRYRDEKQIAKEFVLKKLKTTHPFRRPEPKLKFPNAVAFKRGTPSWLKLEMRKERLGWGRVNDY